MEQSKTLRGLARAYASGQIEKDQYRRERASYLQGVLSGKITVTDQRAAGSDRDVSDTFNHIAFNKDDRPSSGGQADGTTERAKQADKGLISRQNLVIAGVVLIVIIVSLVILLPGGSGDNGAMSEGPTAAGTMRQETVTDRPPSVAENMIASFLEQNSWSQGDLDTFLMNWRSIAESERTTARTSTEFSRLVNAIYKKLLEERALSRIGNAETAYEKQRILVEFASAIGVRDQRITLPEPPPDNMP